MIMNGRASKNYVFVAQEAIQSQKDFDRWVKLALDFNPRAKASKKKKG